MLNTLLMSSSTMSVRTGDCFWLMPVAIVLFMLCNDVSIEWFPLYLCCAMICGSLGFSMVNVEIREMGLYEVYKVYEVHVSLYW